MTLRECFTADLCSRSERQFSAWGLLMLMLGAGYRAAVYYRLASWLKTVRFPRGPATLLGALRLVRLSRVLGVETRARTEIGTGLPMFHPHDIVIGVGCWVGRNVTLNNGATLGAKTLRAVDAEQNADCRYPAIEDGVTTFSGGKVVGPVTIGASSIVGAYSVVRRSFPPNSIIVGALARLVAPRG